MAMIQPDIGASVRKSRSEAQPLLASPDPDQSSGLQQKHGMSISVYAKMTVWGISMQ